MKIKVENAYSDGHEHDLQYDGVIEPTDLSDDALQDVLFEYTGCGHGIDRDLGHCHKVTIMEAGDPGLVGRIMEFDG